MRAGCGIFLFVFPVFPLILGALCMLAMSTWLFDKAFYQELLDRPALYEAIIQELPNNFEGEVYQRTDFTEAQLQQANNAIGFGLREVLTPDYLRQETLSFIDDLFLFFDDPSNAVSIDVNLVPVKDALLGESGGAFAQAVAENLPQCTGGQEPRDPDDPLIGCVSGTLTRDEAVEQAYEDILNRLPALVETIPDQLVINEDWDVSEYQDGPPVQQGYWGATIGVVIGAAFAWLMVALIAGAGTRQRLLWLGVMLLIPAFVVFSLGLSMRAEWSSNVQTFVDSAEFTVNGVPATQTLRDAAAEALTIMLSNVGFGFLVAGAASLGIGLMLLTLGIFSARREESDHKTVVVG